MQPHYSDPLPLGDPHGLPYSKGTMARALVSAGVGIEPAYMLATRLELDLVSSGASAVELGRLEEAAGELLGPEEGAQVVRRLCRLAALRALDVPIVLLVGGATGTGKSTVATEAAHGLGITRVTSTDFIRQTIRAFSTPSSMPYVHVSSFETAGIDGSGGGDLESGFLEQTCQVLVGVEASLDRAMREGWSMAIEGVHLVPGLVPTAIEGALLVHAVLRVDGIEAHRDRFLVRDAKTGGVRAMAKYLDQMDEIRNLQDCIVERAECHHVPVIESTSIETATAALLDLVLEGSESLAVHA